MLYRTYIIDDTPAIIELFYNTVHMVNITDYSLEQVNAWAPDNLDHKLWQNRLERNYSIVAVDGYRITGFGELSPKANIDALYVHHEFRFKGIGSKILSLLEAEAILRDYRSLSLESSITARTFFEEHGYVVIDEQDKYFNNTWFRNYKMEKIII